MFEDSRKPVVIKEISAAELAPQMYEVWSLHYDKILPDWSKMPQLVRGFWIDKAEMMIAFFKHEMHDREVMRASCEFHVKLLYAVLASREPQKEYDCWMAVTKFILEKLPQ